MFRGTILAACLLVVPQTSVLAITPTTMSGIARHISKDKGVSPSNPWMVGASTYIRVTGDGATRDRLRASALGTLDQLQVSRVRIPVMGNISSLLGPQSTTADTLTQNLQDLMSTNEGIHVGLFPNVGFGQFKPTQSWDTEAEILVLFCGASYKLNTFQETSSTQDVYLSQARLSLGFELRSPKFALSKKPLTLSVESAWLLFSSSEYKKAFTEDRSHLWNAEIDLIVPAGPVGGIILEGVVSEIAKPAIRFGFVFAKSVKND